MTTTTAAEGGMRQKLRIAAVNAALVAAGGVFGTIAGALALLVWLAADDPSGITVSNLLDSVFWGIFFGGVPGAVLGPFGAHLLMRHVPLWAAVGGTTVGTAASGGLALLITNHPLLGIIAGLIGFMASVAALHDRFRPTEERVELVEPGAERRRRNS